MSALGNLLLGLLLICAMFVVVFVVVLVFGQTEQRFGGKDWGKLVAGVLATALGIRTLIPVTLAIGYILLRCPLQVLAPVRPERYF